MPTLPAWIIDKVQQPSSERPRIPLPPSDGGFLHEEPPWEPPQEPLRDSEVTYTVEVDFTIYL